MGRVNKKTRACQKWKTRLALERLPILRDDVMLFRKVARKDCLCQPKPFI
jgi:hypothetical protein